MDFILVEPAPEHRRAFARWCLAQTPQIPTATASGSSVPVALFGDVPDEILDGSRIDGHRFRPVVEGLTPDGDGYRTADVVPVVDSARPEPVKTPTRRHNTRKVAGK